jgi:hypothetical protein
MIVFLEIDEKQNVKENEKPLRLEIDLDSERVAIFGKKCQALIGGYDYKALKNRTEIKAFDNVAEFRRSKPSVDNDSIKIFSYRANLKGDLSKFKFVCYKFKTPSVIDAVLDVSKIGNPVDPKKILEFAFDEARKLVPDSATIVDQKGYTFTFDSQNMLTGGSWLPSQITLELQEDKNIYIKTPTLITSKYIPKRGGMCYCKVFTPEDASKILVELANDDAFALKIQKPKRRRRFCFPFC